MSEKELFDLTYRGNNFTWWNKQEDNTIVKKLDRILINDNWLRLLPLSYGAFGDPEFSDHCPENVHFGRPKPPSNRPFKCSKFITLHHDFLSRLKERWESTFISRTAQFSLAKKFKLTKSVLKALNRIHYSQLEFRVNEALKKLADCQSRLLTNPSSALVKGEKLANKTWSSLALSEERFIRQNHG